MVIYLAKIAEPLRGYPLMALCGNCEAVFKWPDPCWHLKKERPVRERCECCGAMNWFVKYLNKPSISPPVWSRVLK